MDDSMINPILLSSSVYLQNVEQLIKNLEKHTNNVQNIDDSSITKSYTSNTNSTTDDANNWTIKSSIEQSINKPQQICSQSNPVSSPGSSTTSSSTSWRQMKESQRLITDTETKQTRSTSPLSLYKIFQQKSQANSSSIRNTSQLSRSIKNVTNQAIQTSIHLTTVSKSKSYNYLIPSTGNTSSSVHKSLPDLSFISHYTKELPRSLTTSPVRSTTNITRTTPSPTLIHQQKQDSDRPRTLKSIKRYKNNKHSTEPLHVFYSPQLRKNSNNHSIPPKQTSNLHEKTLVRKHHSNDDLLKENQIRTSAISYTENISKHFISPCKLSKKSTDHLSMLTKRYGEMRRCQTDIIVVDPILHDHSLTDSPPNEFCLQPDEENDDDEILIEKSHINIVPIETDPSLNSMNRFDSDLLEKINNIIKRLFEIKRSNKTFFLNNETNPQLDSLLKNELCSVIQTILEHGRKDIKKITLWKIIQLSIEENSSSRAFYEAKQIAQNISSNWFYKFQAFIFALLNKNELINWLYYFTRQKELIQRYYQSPDALILVSISSTFNLFERIMTQLEKLTSLPFHLIYHPPVNDDHVNTSMILTNPKDWVMTLSRRSTTKNFSTEPFQTNDTFRATLSRKFTSLFTKTNSTQQRKTSSVVMTKLPETIPSSSPSTDTFQSKIPRPSLNVDKPKSVRYRCTTIPSK